MPLDPEAKAYLDLLAAAGVVPNDQLGVEESRRLIDAGAPALFGPLDPVGAVVEQALPGPAGPLRVRVYEPAAAEHAATGRPYPTLVYFHGGGWVLGSLDSHDGICRALAARTPCVVVAVDYRLAPEHRFPAALDDSWAATAWLAEHAASIGADPARMAVGGDSAGGNLAAAVALRARDRGLGLALQLLVYPVTDRNFDRPSYIAYADGYGLTRQAMRWYWDLYLGPAGDGSQPDASPLRATDVSGVAPALVITAECDPLCDEGEEYAALLADAGVPVTLSRYDGIIHGFFRMPGTISRGNHALDEAAAALAGAFS